MMVEFSSAISENKSEVYGEIEDIYIFDFNGNFERKSVVLLAHDNKEGSMNLILSQPFPNYQEENHKILSNITYKLYRNWCLNKSFSKTPEEDFKKGETITTIENLDYGDRAHIERIYFGKFNPEDINLRLNFKTIYENPECGENECGNYNYQSFKRVIKIKKSIYLGLKELNIKNLVTNPDKIYNDGRYNVYIWESFTLDLGDLKFQDIKFSYDYRFPLWVIWSTFSLILTFLITRYYYNKKPPKELRKLKQFLANPLQIKHLGEKAGEGIKRFFEKE